MPCMYDQIQKLAITEVQEFWTISDDCQTNTF